MAGVYYDENGIPRADDGSGRMEQFGVGAIPPPPAPIAAGAAPFVGTPSQAPAGFSGASPLTATPSGASGSWDGPSAPAAPDAGGLIDVEGNGATAAPMAGAAGIGTGAAPAADFGMGTKTVTTSGGMTAGAQRDLLGSMADMNAATDEQKVAQQLINGETAVALRQKELATQQFERQEAEKQANIEKAKIDWDQKIKSADDQYRGASIDSGRMWRDSSTGSKIAAGVGIMLGALGQAITGQDNPAIKMIEAAVDRDIDIQKANMEKAGKEAGMTRSAYSTYLQATGSEAAARNQMHLLALQNIDASLSVATAKHQDTLVAANATKAKADLKMKVQERIAEKSTYQQVKTQEALAGPKPVPPGTMHWDQHIGDTMTSKLAVISAGEKISAVLDDTSKAEKFMGPVDARLLDFAASVGFKVSPEYLDYKTQTGVLTATILKVMSGVGVNEKEHERWKALLPIAEKDPENAKQQIKTLLAKYKDEYTTERGTNRGRLASPESVTAYDNTFPDLMAKEKAEQKQDFNAKK